MTKIIPIANHQITNVTTESNNYTFDPTNDGYLKKGTFNQLVVANDEFAKMKIINWEQVSMGFLGTIKSEYNLLSLYKNLNKPNISNYEYTEIYLETLKICMQNTDLFELFYEDNKNLYKDIYNISEEQNDLIHRMVPIIPKFKVKERRRLK